MTTANLETRRPAANTAVPAAHSAERMRRVARRWRYLTNAGAALISALILVWTLTPIYNIIMVSLEAEGDVSVTHIFPPQPSMESFWVVITEGHWYLEAFCRSGSTRRDWQLTTIPHKTELTFASKDRRHLRLRTLIEPDVEALHEIRAGKDDVAGAGGGEAVEEGFLCADFGCDGLPASAPAQLVVGEGGKRYGR